MTEKYDPNQDELNLPEQIAKVAESDVAISRKNFFRLTGTLAAVAAGKALSSNEARAQAFIPQSPPGSSQRLQNTNIPMVNIGPKTAPYVRDFWSDLDPSNIPPPNGLNFNDSTEEFPPLLYDHNAKGIRRKVQGSWVNIDTDSPVFEVSKMAWYKIEDKVKADKQRKIIIEELRKAKDPDHKVQEKMREVYGENDDMGEKLKELWGPLEKQSGSLVKKVMALVKKERSASKSLKWASDVNGTTMSGKDVIPVAQLKDEYSDEFDDYDELQPWLRPYPFNCDDIILGEERRPSSLPEVEAIIGLKLLAEQHFIAALKRQAAYHSMISFAKITGRSQNKLLAYAKRAASQNGTIVKGWDSVVTETREIYEEGIKAKKIEMTWADNIDRCRPPTP